MPDFERHNRQAIDQLNQRGGRMLSLVDLLDAGTLDLDMAAALAYAASAGGSFLTAAGLGGVGKTTLMGAALAFLGPRTEIVTIEGPETLDRLAAQPTLKPTDPPQCLVVHEISAGDYFGYLWGADVARYFDLAVSPGRSLASNLHAETYGEAVAQLTGAPLGVSLRALGMIDILAFMAASRGKRRVTDLWITDGPAALYDDPRPGTHRAAWSWRGKEDRFDAVGPSAAASIAARRGGRSPESVAADLDRFRAFLASAQADGVTRMEALRDHALAQLLTSPS
jgi:hypothetical protein